MRKVKTKPVRCYQRPLLFYMRSKNGFQRLLKKMGRTVILCGSARLGASTSSVTVSPLLIHRFTYPTCPVFSAQQLYGIFYNKHRSRGPITPVSAYLSALGCIERRLSVTMVPFCPSLNQLDDQFFCSSSSPGTIAVITDAKCQRIIAEELCLQRDPSVQTVASAPI